MDWESEEPKTLLKCLLKRPALYFGDAEDLLSCLIAMDLGYRIAKNSTEEWKQELESLFTHDFNQFVADYYGEKIGSSMWKAWISKREGTGVLGLRKLAEIKALYDEARESGKWPKGEVCE